MIAAITSCTNTSNPSVMVAAGLLAKKAVEAGLADQAVGQDVAGAGLPRGDRLPGPRRAHAVPGEARVRASSATAARPASGTRARCPTTWRRRSTTATSTWSPCCPATGTSRGASTRRCARATWHRRRSCVAYALAGRVDIDLTREPLGDGRRRARASCATSGRRPTRSRESIATAITASSSSTSTPGSGTATSGGARCPTPDRTGVRLGSRRRRTCRSRRSSSGLDDAATAGDIEGARVLVKVGDSITTDHISPAGSIKARLAGGRVPRGARRASRREFNSLRVAAREPRGDDARARSRTSGSATSWHPGTEGSWTTHLPDGEVMIDLRRRERYRDDGVPLAVLAGQGVRQRVQPRLGGEGPGAARRAVRDRRELRADPPLQPRRDGRPAAAVRGGASPRHRSG